MHATAVRVSVASERKRTMQAHLRRLVGHLSVEDILAYPLAQARAEAKAFSGLLSDVVIHSLEDANPKLYKSAKVGRPTIGLTFLPADSSDWEMCPWRSEGCTQSCLRGSGRGSFSSVEKGRAWKTALLGENPLALLRIAFAEITAFAKRCAKADVPGAWRGNILSDVDWTKACPALLEHVVAELGETAPYDYTKDVSRFTPRDSDTPAISAYRRNLTFSASENTSDEYLVGLLASGRVPRVAVVFAARVSVSANESLRPTSWNGFPVANADTHDYRPGDGTGVISGLLAKDVASASFADGVISGFFRSLN